MASCDLGKEWVCGWIRENFPQNAKILDVGACDGKWRKLLPEYTMDAVEAFLPNCERISTLYRVTFNADVSELKYDDYDLIIFGDVIEHMSVEAAQKTLIYADTHCRDMIVAVPYLFKQGPLYGNPWEVHKQDDLTAENFAERYPKLAVLYDTNQNYCFYHKELKS